jgi:hypothetical protein
MDLNYNVVYSVKSKSYVKITKEKFAEFYSPFSKVITEKELMALLKELNRENRTTGGVVNDLILAIFVKQGFSQKHLHLLSRFMGHRYYRAGYLRQRIADLKEIIAFIDNNSNIQNLNH